MWGLPTTSAVGTEGVFVQKDEGRSTKAECDLRLQCFGLLVTA